jgi:hypothetical protein
MALRSVALPSAKLLSRLHLVLRQYAPGLCTQTEFLLCCMPSRFGLLRRNSTIIRVAFILLNKWFNFSKIQQFGGEGGANYRFGSFCY